MPEAPLLALAAVAPVIACELTGIRGICRAGRLTAGVIAGGLVGMMAGAVAGLSLLALNQLFFDAVSRQPDKILNYQASGLPSMREYLLLNGVINVVMGLALGSTGGAVPGGVGALVGKLFPCRVSSQGAAPSTASGGLAARNPSGAESNPTAPGQFDIDRQ